MTPGRNIVRTPRPAPLRPDDVARLKMKKASEECACVHDAQGFRVRFCDKHRPAVRGGRAA